MKTRALARNLPMSAQKLRLGADLVRGMKVVTALELLRATNKKSAQLIETTLQSATSNAQNNDNVGRAKLRINEIRVDEGRKLKRFRPRARGHASSIVHRYAHLTVVVSDDAQVQASTVEPTKKTDSSVREKK